LWMNWGLRETFAFRDRSSIRLLTRGSGLRMFRFVPSSNPAPIRRGAVERGPFKGSGVPLRWNERRQRRPSGRRGRRRIIRSGDRFSEQVDPGRKAVRSTAGTRAGRGRPDRPRLPEGFGSRRSPARSGGAKAPGNRVAGARSEGWGHIGSPVGLRLGPTFRKDEGQVGCLGRLISGDPSGLRTTLQ
jgi:hypothetical protein